MEISGDNLTLYIDGKPLTACDKIDLIVTERCTEEWTTGVEYTFEVGKWETPESTFEQEWNYNWWMARTYPRKKKKAYRKWLKSLIA